MLPLTEELVDAMPSVLKKQVLRVFVSLFN